MSRRSEIYLAVNAIPYSEREVILSRQTPEEAATSIETEVLSKIAGAAKALEVPIILRAVNPDAFPLLKRGAVGKNMAVHGKSSEESILAAYIPERASISKAGKRSDPGKIEAANEENRHSLEASEALIEQYRLALRENSSDKETIFAEVKNKAVIAVPLLTKRSEKIYIFENIKGLSQKNKEGTIFSVKFGEDYYSIDADHNIGPKVGITSGYTPKEVNVITKPIIDVSGEITGVTPITADIDVLVYGSRLNDLSHSSYDSGSVETMIGQGPDLIKTLVRDVIGPRIGRDLISHGPEQYNLDYVQPLEPPWVAVESNMVKIIPGENELLAFFNLHKPRDRIVGAGYIKQTNIEPNPHWAWELDARTKSYKINPDLKKTFENIDIIIGRLCKSSSLDDKELVVLFKKYKIITGMAYLDETVPLERKESLKLQLDRITEESGLALEVPLVRESAGITEVSSSRELDLSPSMLAREYASRDRTGSSIFAVSPPPSAIRITPDEDMCRAVAAEIEKSRRHESVRAAAGIRSTLTVAGTSASGNAASEYTRTRIEAAKNAERNTKSSWPYR